MYVENKRALVLCHSCNGTGKKDYTEQRGPLIKGSVEACRNCNGSGREYLVEKTWYEKF